MDLLLLATLANNHSVPVFFHRMENLKMILSPIYTCKYFQQIKTRCDFHACKGLTSDFLSHRIGPAIVLHAGCPKVHHSVINPMRSDPGGDP